MSENVKKSSPAMILLAWLLVCAPLAWGVYNTVLNSMKLFQGSPATGTPAPTQSPAATQPPANPTKN